MTSHEEQTAAAPGPPPVPRGAPVVLGLTFVIALVVVLPLLAVFTTAEAAVWTLSVAAAGLAVLRMFSDVGGVLHVRGRAFDAAVLAAASVGLGLLAPLASTADVVAGL